MSVLGGGSEYGTHGNTGVVTVLEERPFAVCYCCCCCRASGKAALFHPQEA